MKYQNKPRYDGTFTLTALENEKGGKNTRLVFYLDNDPGLLAVWGTENVNTAHIDDLKNEMSTKGFPIRIKCQWIDPDDYQRDNFNHSYWICENDKMKIV